MSDLVAFIKERLDEDEAAAREAAEASDGSVWTDFVYSTHRFLFHIERHDPARVLREVATKRAIIAAHPVDTEYDLPACRACQWDVDCDAPKQDLEPSDCPCPTLRNLAWPWHEEDGWAMAWCPHHEEDRAETDPRGCFRVFKRTCRHCQADLGKILKPREEAKS